MNHPGVSKSNFPVAKFKLLVAKSKFGLTEDLSFYFASDSLPLLMVYSFGYRIHSVLKVLILIYLFM